MTNNKNNNTTMTEKRTKFAIITLSGTKDENSNNKLGHQQRIRKAIAPNRLLKGWKVNKVTILSD